MKRSGQLITLACTAMLVLTGCQPIKLSGGKNGGTGGGTGGGTTQTGGGSRGGNNDAVLNPNATPAINGDWKLTFVYGDNTYDSLVTFAQQGRALSGSGEDSAGPFLIQAGVVDGTKVKFTKKYADADPSKRPVMYSGELEFEDDEDYKGWRMGGHYKATGPDGGPIDDKWVAISTVAEEAFANSHNAPPQQQQQAPPDGQPTSENPDQQQPAENVGGRPADLSGKYTAEYQFNFKKIHSTMWLEQDGGRLGGHGVDNNTNEKFVITKGFYNFPRMQITCHYTKGQNAAATRDLVVKATVANGPSLKGETQFGGGWQARIVR
jgi:hypothetical protein